MARVLLTMDPQQARGDSSRKLAARNDWRRAGRFLKGTYPAPMPEMLLWRHAEDAAQLLKVFGDAPFVVCDTEYQYDPKQTRPWDRATRLDLVGLYGPGTPVLQVEPSRCTKAQVAGFTDWLRRLIKDQTMVFQNTSADVVVLDKFLGIKWGEYGETEDTMTAHAALWAELPHSLEFLASVYGRHEKLKHLAHTQPLLYNAGDVLETANTWLQLSLELQDDAKTMEVYRRYLMPLRPIIMAAENRGIRIDADFVEPAREILSSQTAFAVDVANAHAGYDINLNGSEQLLSLLKEEGIKLTTMKAEKLIAERNKFLDVVIEEGKPEDLTPDKLWERIDDGAHPLLEARASFIQADKQLSAYISPLFDDQGTIKPRVYPHFLPTAQDNGRWSTTEPPLAQLPEALRKLLIPDAGFPWIGWDWSAIELRILAAMSKDKMLLDAFANDWDLHTIHCCELFGYDLPQDLAHPHSSEVDAEWREKLGWIGKDDKRRVFAKTFVYRTIYGGDPRGAGKLPGATKLGVSAAELVRGSFGWIDKHEALKKFWKWLKSDALSKGEVRAFTGRRRRLQETDPKRRVRQAFDQPCQAGTSDIFNDTVIEIAKALPNSYFVYGCHDSQYHAVPLAELADSFRVVKEIVEREWDIFGTPMTFTGSFKFLWAPEDKHRASEFNGLIRGE